MLTQIIIAAALCGQSDPGQVAPAEEQKALLAAIRARAPARAAELAPARARAARAAQATRAAADRRIAEIDLRLVELQKRRGPIDEQIELRRPPARTYSSYQAKIDAMHADRSDPVMARLVEQSNAIDQEMRALDAEKAGLRAPSRKAARKGR